MRGFVRFLRACRVALFGVPHRHRWTVRETIPVYSGSKRPSSYLYVMQCRDCGEIKQRKVAS